MLDDDEPPTFGQHRIFAQVRQRRCKRCMTGEQGIKTTDLEDLGDDRLQCGDRNRHAGGACLLRSDHQHAQAGAADELQTGEVKHEVLPTAGHHRGELLLQIRCGQGIEAAGELYGVDSRLIGAGSSDDLNIKWHDGLL